MCRDDKKGWISSEVMRGLRGRGDKSDIERINRVERGFPYTF